MISLKRMVLVAAAFSCGLGAQTPPNEGEPLGAPLRLAPPGSLPPRQRDREAAPLGPVERTYQRPKVESFSHDRDQVAIQGYDVVAYLDGTPRKGRKEYSAEHGGVTWLFATPDDRDAFRRDPERYVPQYGGFCAYSITLGSPARADPRIFAVAEGRVYLFFDTAVRAVWQQDREHAIAAANGRWPVLHR